MYHILSITEQCIIGNQRIHLESDKAGSGHVQHGYIAHFKKYPSNIANYHQL